MGPNPLIDAGGPGDGDAGDGDSGDGDPGDGDPGDGDLDHGDPSDSDGDPGDCDNGILDGDETDVDCGGSCSGCEPGGACLVGGDCDSSVCDAEVCAAATCTDGVKNGDERNPDCGGSCRFCAHSEFVAQLDDFEGGHAAAPNVAMFQDGVFAVLYSSFGDGFRLRWFDEFAAPISTGIPVTDQVTQSDPYSARGVIATQDLDSHDVFAVINGLNAMSTSTDVFSIRRGPNTSASHLSIYQGPDTVFRADGVLDGNIATFVFEKDGEVWLRRHNYSLNIPLGTAIRANPDFALRPAKHATITQRNGVAVVAWFACDPMDPNDCDLELRSSDFGWIEDAPVKLNLAPQGYGYPEVAVGEDGRVALAWGGGVTHNRQAWAALLEPGLVLDGAPWLLQDSIPTFSLPTPDVIALEDGNFAFAWGDSPAQRVHIRRFSGPDLPLVTDVGDEAAWPASDSVAHVRMATAARLVSVVWSGSVDSVLEIQGQVLSY
ncbi:Endo-1,4-beta-xylanase A precursor [Enhygromyxa salina]|uniref:Endo-1,4-beta-xylanase A n=1 Tax=Enhygromyxa salina TaxID=215803 RepID=A0A0C1ZYP3_9BACT|nr:Endo-1,4-beta-xylanase A precursor [Enhygromyxa salina]